MSDKIKNLYNRPFFYGCILSGISVILFCVMLYFYLAKPYTRFDNSMFQGAAVFQDFMNIFWGYVVDAVFMVCGLVIFNLAYQAKRSDYPKAAKIIEGFSLINVGAAIIFTFWFTIQVLVSFSII